MDSCDSAAIAGDADSFEAAVHASTAQMLALFDANRSGLFATLRRMQLPREDVEDVLQETCVRLLTAPPLWQGERSCCGYIFKVAANLGRDALRRRRRRGYGHFTALEDEIIECDRPKPAETIEQGQMAEALSYALERLTPRCQKAISLHYAHEWSFARIGLQLGISKKTVERDILLARQYCHAVLARGMPA